MAVKIRLSRRGRKKLAMFDVVVADARAPRDGRFIEKLGTYNPNTNPATVVLNEKQAIKWVMDGAQPTDTAKAILSYKGILYAKHLQVGVIKGALTQEQADAKFEAWKAEKEIKIQTKAGSIQQSKAKSKATRLEAESKVSANRAVNIAAKNKVADDAIVASVVASINETDEDEIESVLAEVAVDEVVAAEVAVEEVVAEAPAAEVAVEEAPAVEEVAEVPAVEEVLVEAPAAEAVIAEAAVEEVVVEAPAAEAVIAEAAAEAPVSEVAVEEVVAEAPAAEAAVEEVVAEAPAEEAPTAEATEEEAPAAE
jgi:small subunit ribosomal protein S16